MAITIDSNGANITTQVENYNEIKDEILININPNITFESNTVAGVFTNIIALAERQLSEAVLNSINQLNPTTATGVALDKLTIFYPSVFRQSATYTVQNIAITTSINNVFLIGLDTSPDGNNVFTISDVNSNKYFLQNSITIATAGVNNYSFRAENIGAISSSLNTITNINSPVNGVQEVNNPTSPSQVGVNEQSDSSLLTQILIAKASKQKDIERIQIALSKLSGVVSATVYQNRATTTQNGIPANHIYAVVEGGTAGDIGKAINDNTPAGILTFGLQSVNVIENNLPIVIYYDVVGVVNFYIKLNVKVETNQTISASLLKEYIVNNYKSKVGKNIINGDVVYVAEQYLLDTGGVLLCELSLDNVSFANQIIVPNLKTRYAITASNITVNLL